ELVIRSTARWRRTPQLHAEFIGHSSLPVLFTSRPPLFFSFHPSHPSFQPDHSSPLILPWLLCLLQVHSFQRPFCSNSNTVQHTCLCSESTTLVPRFCRILKPRLLGLEVRGTTSIRQIPANVLLFASHPSHEADLLTGPFQHVSPRPLGSLHSPLTYK